MEKARERERDTESERERQREGRGQLNPVRRSKGRSGAGSVGRRAGATSQRSLISRVEPGSHQIIMQRLHSILPETTPNIIILLQK